MIERTQTAVSLNYDELQALIDLAKLATARNLLSIAEQLYYNGLLTRFANEIEAQTRDMQFTATASASMPPDVSSDTQAV